MGMPSGAVPNAAAPKPPGVAAGVVQYTINGKPVNFACAAGSYLRNVNATSSKCAPCSEKPAEDQGEWSRKNWLAACPNESAPSIADTVSNALGLRGSEGFY